jgi:hypothetical protein
MRETAQPVLVSNFPIELQQPINGPGPIDD